MANEDNNVHWRAPAHRHPPVLYINLAQAVQRRRNIEGNIAQFLPEAKVVQRVEAVDGASLRQDPAAAPITPHARFILSNRQLASNHFQLESWGAVGCTLSHGPPVRVTNPPLHFCWGRHGGPPSSAGTGCSTGPPTPRPTCWSSRTTPASPSPASRSCGTTDQGAVGTPPPARRVRTLCGPPHLREWDVLLLGFVDVHNAAPVVVQGQTLWTLLPGGSLFGTHAYLVTRRGAAILRQYAFPVEVQVDAYMVTLQQLGRLRLYMVDEREVVEQCLSSTEKGIDHAYVPATLPTVMAACSANPRLRWMLRRRRRGRNKNKTCPPPVADRSCRPSSGWCSAVCWRGWCWCVVVAPLQHDRGRRRHEGHAEAQEGDVLGQRLLSRQAQSEQLGAGARRGASGHRWQVGAGHAVDAHEVAVREDHAGRGG